MPSEQEIKNLFIREELDIHGEYLVDILIETIEKKGLIDTEQLLQNLEYSVINNPYGYKLEFSFYSYGRAIEIQQHKRRSGSFSENVNTNAAVWGITSRKKKKNTQWYSRNVYGSLNRLIGRIMYGLSDETRKRLIGILTSGHGKAEGIVLSTTKGI